MSTFLKTGFGKVVLAAGVLIIIIAAVLIYQSTTEEDEKADINILTRHSTEITNTFTEEFLKSDFAKDIGYGPGDSDKLNFIASFSTTAWITALESDAVPVDLAWGGGPTLFNQMLERDLLASIEDTDLLAVVEASVPESVAGVDMRKSEGGKLMWVANAISSFGFVVNNDTLTDYGLEKPTTWEDLASPDFFVSTAVDTVGMGNPTQSSSIRRTYAIILQKFGWDKGWEIIGGMAGNGGFYGGSSGTKQSAVDGTVAAAFTIDFIGISATEECNCEYVIPENGSIVNGDPIAFGAKSMNPEGAQAFFKYVNSAEGQTVWLGENRLPINVDVFDTDAGKARQDIKDLYDFTLVNEGVDFNDTLADIYDFAMQHYTEAVMADSHTELKNAWDEAVTGLDDGDLTQGEFDADVAALFAPQITQEEAITLDSQLIDDEALLLSTKSDWTTAAKATYNAYSVPLAKSSQNRVISSFEVDEIDSAGEPRLSSTFIMISLLSRD
ncbi:MAG: ABC transporter substrate-binding protein [Candidatus Kariarchaeaceae archaeon]|jgi:ABC-type Fe3+ transport system substrate-binding protein